MGYPFFQQFFLIYQQLIPAAEELWNKELQLIGKYPAE